MDRSAGLRRHYDYWGKGMGMGRRWRHRDDDRRGSGGTRGSGHDKASASKSYHNGGVEGGAFSRWYDKYLAKHAKDIEEDSEGSGGTKGSGSGGTKGTDNHDNDTGGDPKPSESVTFGDPPQVTVTATATAAGQIFIDIQPVSFDGEVADVDGLAFNLTSNATLDGLNFFSDPLSLPVTGFTAAADAVDALPNGEAVGGTFDAAVQFGQQEGSTDGVVNTVNFTLWSDNGPLTLDDIDLSDMSLVVTDADGQTQILSGELAEDDESDPEGSGSGGTKGSGSGGTKGSGSGGTKGSGSGGTKDSGSGGTKGSGSGGTTGGHGQWTGHDASVAASALPTYKAYPEDAEDNGANDEFAALITHDADAEYDTPGTATAGDAEIDFF